MSSRPGRLAFLVLTTAVAGCFTSKGSGDLVVTDANNYTFDVSVDFESVDLAAGEDAVVDWSSIATDMRGNPMPAPEEVEIVRLVELALTQDETEQEVATGELTQQDIRTPWEFYNDAGVSSCNLTDFSVQGNNFNPADGEIGFLPRATDSSWVISLWRTNPKLLVYEILSSAFLVPVDKGGGSAFTFSDDSADLSFNVDLRSATPLNVGAGLDEYTLNWEGLANDASGREFDPLKATWLFIAHITDAADVSALEPALLTHLDNADTWLLDVYGEREADLMQALAPEGGSFPGFDDTGIWLVGIMDPTGNDPSPYFMAVVTVQ